MLKQKKLLFMSCVLLLSINTFSQQSNLYQGKTIAFSKGKFNVVKIESASFTPIQKVEAKS